VKRTGGNLGAVSASFATAPNSAQAVSDYIHTNGVLTWADGDTSIKTFTVPIVNDGIVETNENLRLTLTALVGALPGTSTNVLLTIVEDDSYGTFQFSSSAYLADEIGSNATVTIVRNGGSVGNVSVRIQTQQITPPGAGVATNGLDYVGVSNIINFGPGQVTAAVPITLLNDLIGPEGDEAFRVVLSLPTGGATVGSLSNAIVTIVDNETVSGPAGSRDTEFVALGADGAISAMTLHPTNGSIIVGGDFRHVNNVLRVRLARLLSNGLLDKIDTYV